MSDAQETERPPEPEHLSAERVDLSLDEIALVDRLAGACGRDRMGTLRWLIIAALADRDCWPPGTDEEALANLG